MLREPVHFASERPAVAFFRPGVTGPGLENRFVRPLLLHLSPDPFRVPVAQSFGMQVLHNSLAYGVVGAVDLFVRVFFQIEQLRRLPVIVDVFPVFAPDHPLKSAFGRAELVGTVFGIGDVLPIVALRTAVDLGEEAAAGRIGQLRSVEGVKHCCGHVDGAHDTLAALPLGDAAWPAHDEGDSDRLFVEDVFPE